MYQGWQILFGQNYTCTEWPLSLHSSTKEHWQTVATTGTSSLPKSSTLARARPVTVTHSQYPQAVPPILDTNSTITLGTTHTTPCADYQTRAPPCSHHPTGSSYLLVVLMSVEAPRAVSDRGGGICGVVKALDIYY